MRLGIAIALCLAWLALADTPKKQTTQIVRVSALPSEAIPSGPCKASTAGYLGIGERTDLTEAEIGEYLKAALREGYVVTVYPPTKRGIFVNAECNPSKR